MGRPGDDTDRLIRYLIDACPSSLEDKSDTGYTPLYLACLLGRVRSAKTLIDAGADQAVRDMEYNNLVRIFSALFLGSCRHGVPTPRVTRLPCLSH